MNKLPDSGFDKVLEGELEKLYQQSTMRFLRYRKEFQGTVAVCAFYTDGLTTTTQLDKSECEKLATNPNKKIADVAMHVLLQWPTA